MSGAAGRMDGRLSGATPLTAPGPDLRLYPAAAVAWLTAWWGCSARSGVVLPAAAATVLALLALLATLAWLTTRAPGNAAPRPGPFAQARGLPTVAHGRPERWAAGGLALLLAAAAMVLASTGVRLAGRERDPLTAAAAAHRYVQLSGTIRGDPHLLAPAFTFGGAGVSDRYAVTLAVDRIVVQNRSVASSATAVVIAGEPWAALTAGEHVRAGVRLEPADPGDAALAIGFARGRPTVLDRGAWPWRVAERLRAGLRSACRDLPADARGLLPALVVGDTSELDPALKADLQAAGLSHLTAVSGANVGIVAAAMLGAVALMGGGRKVRLIGSALAVVGFVVLARPEPSVLRASVMGILMLAGLLWARRGAGLPVLAATAVILLVADPWLARSYGFVLSVLATAGLLLIVPAWLARPHRLPRWAVLALAVPVAAQLATAPVTVLLNPVVSVVAVPANLLAEVAVAPATIAGVLAAAVSPLWPTGARLVAWPGGLATEWIALVAHRAATVPHGSVPWPAGPFGALLLGLVSALLIAPAFLRPRVDPAHPDARRPGPAVQSGLRSGLCVGAAVMLVAGVLTAPRWVWLLPPGRAWPPSDWVVVQCDVGQGSATLIRSGEHRAVMVDTGPDPALADRCLRRAHVNALDLVLLTHFHSDHAGGITGALRGRGRPPIVVSPLAEPRDQVREVTAAARAIGVTPIVVGAPVAGESGQAPWTVRWRLFPPPPHLAVASGGDDGTEINNGSVVLAAEVRGIRVVALGDVEPEAQRPLLNTFRQPGGVGPADVVVMAHHGSARQEPALYHLLRPRVALIGVGLDNDYGHPAPSALALLRQVGALTLRTDLQGQLAVAGSAAGLQVATTK